MSAIIFCFCCFISWQRSIMVASMGCLTSAGAVDCAWTGDQMARAKANAKLERIMRREFVWCFMFYGSPYVLFLFAANVRPTALFVFFSWLLHPECS